MKVSALAGPGEMTESEQLVSQAIPEGFAPIDKPSSFGQLIGPVYERGEGSGEFRPGHSR